MRNKGMDYIITLLGLLLLGTVSFLIKVFTDPQGIMRALPYLCIGLGCGTLGHGIGNIVSRKSLKDSPTLQKQMNVTLRYIIVINMRS